MPKLHYRMTALKDYRNGSIAWPKGLSGFWPQGETRLLLPPVYEQIVRDGGEFQVVPVVVPDAVEAPAPAPAAEPSAADKRRAGLEKARAAKAAKKAEQSAGE